MTQFEPTFQPPSQSAEAKTSGLAIASLVCSLIFCCPATTVVGILLGFIALATIGSDPMKKGKGMAIAGVIIGIVATAAQVWGGFLYWDKIVKPVMEGPKVALEAGFAGDPAGFKAAMHFSGTAPSDAEVEAFIAALRERYGEFQSVAMSQQGSPQPSFGTPSQVFPYTLVFDNARVDANVNILFADERTGAFILKPDWIEITDPDLGNLRFPPAAPPAAPPAGGGGGP